MATKDLDLKLTSVKLETDNYTKFKIGCVGSDITLQKLINRTLYLYNTDEKFAQKIRDTAIPIEGSNGAL